MRTVRVFQKIESDIALVDAEIRKLQEKKRLLEKQRELLEHLPELCPSCEGKGTETYTDAAGSIDWRECKTCRGLGKIGPIQCSCGHVIGTDMTSLRRQSSPRCPWCGAGLGGQYQFWY